MTVKELSDLLNSALKNHPDCGDHDIRILLNEKSIGPRATAGVKSVGFGFDWERGKVLLQPEKDLVSKDG